jgi:hypothetical protein
MFRDVPEFIDDYSVANQVIGLQKRMAALPERFMKELAPQVARIVDEQASSTIRRVIADQLNSFDERLQILESKFESLIKD